MHREMLEFHRALLTLRKHHKCLSNYRKDLIAVDFNDRERWITIERRDPSGERALVVCNLSDHKIEIPIARGGVTLALFGGQDGAQPPSSQLAAGPQRVTLDRAGAAIYLSTL